MVPEKGCTLPSTSIGSQGWWGSWLLVFRSRVFLSSEFFLGASKAGKESIGKGDQLEIRGWHNFITLLEAHLDGVVCCLSYPLGKFRRLRSTVACL